MNKKRIFEILQIGQENDKVSRGFDYFIIVNIVLNILVVILDTFEELSEYNALFRWIEIVTTFIFLIEYILRIWTADLLYPKLSRGKAVLRFIRSFDGVVDLFTIIPVFFLSGAVAFRMLRVVRILHLFRINARYDSFHAILGIIYEKRKQLLSSLFIIFILMLASSICMYSAEHAAQPDVFKNAFSGFWWSVTTNHHCHHHVVFGSWCGGHPHRYHLSRIRGAVREGEERLKALPGREGDRRDRGGQEERPQGQDHRGDTERIRNERVSGDQGRALGHS